MGGRWVYVKWAKTALNQAHIFVKDMTVKARLPNDQAWIVCCANHLQTHRRYQSIFDCQNIISAMHWISTQHRLFCQFRRLTPKYSPNNHAKMVCVGELAPNTFVRHLRLVFAMVNRNCFSLPSADKFWVGSCNNLNLIVHVFFLRTNRLNLAESVRWVSRQSILHTIWAANFLSSFLSSSGIFIYGYGLNDLVNFKHVLWSRGFHKKFLLHAAKTLIFFWCAKRLDEFERKQFGWKHITWEKKELISKKGTAYNLSLDNG